MPCKGYFQLKLTLLSLLPWLLAVGFLAIELGSMMGEEPRGVYTELPRDMIGEELEGKFRDVEDEIQGALEEVMECAEEGWLGEGGSDGQKASDCVGVLKSHLQVFDGWKLIEYMQIVVEDQNNNIISTTLLPATVTGQIQHESSIQGWRTRLTPENITIWNTKKSTNFTISVYVSISKDHMGSRTTFGKLRRGVWVSDSNNTYQFNQYQENDPQMIPEEFHWTFIINNTNLLNITIIDKTGSFQTDYKGVPIYFLLFIFLIIVYTTPRLISSWCHRYFSIVSNIENILRTTLQDSFSKKPTKKQHIVISQSSDLQKICEKYLQLTCDIGKPTPSKPIVKFKQPFKFEPRLRYIVTQFQQVCIPKASEICKEVLNNKVILHTINAFMEEQEAEFNYLLREAVHQRVYYCAYMALITKNTEDFGNFVLVNIPKGAARRNPSIALEENSSEVMYKVHSELDLQFFQDVNFNLRSKNIEELMKQPPFNSILPKMRSDLIVPALLRMQNLLLSKYLFMIKDSDIGRKYLVSLDLVEKLQEIEQEIDNVRYQLSEHNKIFRS